MIDELSYHVAWGLVNDHICLSVRRWVLWGRLIGKKTHGRKLFNIHYLDEKPGFADSACVLNCLLDHKKSIREYQKICICFHGKYTSGILYTDIPIIRVLMQTIHSAYTNLLSFNNELAPPFSQIRKVVLLLGKENGENGIVSSTSSLPFPLYLPSPLPPLLFLSLSLSLRTALLKIVSVSLLSLSLSFFPR